MFNLQNVRGAVNNAYELLTAFIPDLSKAKTGHKMAGKYLKGWKRLATGTKFYRDAKGTRECSRRINQDHLRKTFGPRKYRQLVKRIGKPGVHYTPRQEGFDDPGHLAIQPVKVTPRPVNSFEGWPINKVKARRTA